MIIIVAKWIVIFFGIFVIFVGFLMLFAPKKAREILRSAASSNIIHYSEISIRLIPAVGLILYSDLSKYPIFLNTLGWFMFATSLVLYVVPRRFHHIYALKSADILKPLYIQLLSPISFLFGVALIYAVL